MIITPRTRFVAKRILFDPSEYRDLTEADQSLLKDGYERAIDALRRNITPKGFSGLFAGRQPGLRHRRQLSLRLGPRRRQDGRLDARPGGRRHPRPARSRRLRTILDHQAPAGQIPANVSIDTRRAGIRRRGRHHVDRQRPVDFHRRLGLLPRASTTGRSSTSMPIRCSGRWTGSAVRTRTTAACWRFPRPATGPTCSPAATTCSTTRCSGTAAWCCYSQILRKLGDDRAGRRLPALGRARAAGDPQELLAVDGRTDDSGCRPQLQRRAVRPGRRPLSGRPDLAVQLQLAVRRVRQHAGVPDEPGRQGAGDDDVPVPVGRGGERPGAGQEPLSAGPGRRPRVARLLHRQPAQPAEPLPQRRHLAVHRRAVGPLHPQAGDARPRPPRAGEAGPALLARASARSGSSTSGTTA